LRSRLHPQAIVVDVGVRVDSLDDVASGYVDAVGLFDDVTQGEAKGAVAPREELEGVSVVVNGGAGFQAVFLHDDFGAGPLEEGFLNQEAGGVFADFAQALVAGQVLFLGFEDFGSALGDGGFLSAGKLVHVSSF
jgi:hypothetical protein